MSYTGNDLADEINAVLDHLAATEEDWNAKWIANQVVKNHQAELAGQYAYHCAYEHTRRITTHCINTRAGDKPEDHRFQYIMEGFTRLRNYYMVDRDGEEIGVHVNHMTVTDFDDKIAFHRALARANDEHADELQRYRDRKFGDDEIVA